MEYALAIIGGYLIGSIPFCLILTRLGGYGDIRNIGSGNIGATNVLRTGNKKLAIATLILDSLKGAMAVGGLQRRDGAGCAVGAGCLEARVAQRAFEYQPAGGVVVHDQGAAAEQLGRRSGIRNGLVDGLQGQSEMEVAAFAGLADDADVAAHGFDKPARHAEAEAHAVARVGCRSVLR